MKNNNNNLNRNHHNNAHGSNNNYQQSNNNDRKSKQQQYHNQQQQHQHQQQQHQQHQQQQHQQHQQHQQQQQFHGQRDRSGQRNQQGGQHPDSSMGRDNNAINQSNLGSIRFNPGYPTRELPPIETKADPSKKFTGRCRLFVGNLPHNTSEEKMRNLFERYGEVGEVFLGPKSAFAFIKMDTRQNAEAARDALDCSNYENRTLRVRLAAHAAAIRIKHLSPQVSNELLVYAFRYFGEIERAVVVVDDKGKSTGEGVIEYTKKQSALYAIKRCQQDCFMLTASPKPVLVEPYDQQDEDEGLPEKSINKNSIEYKEQRDVGPRFAEQGTFEHTFALRWKELYDVEKQKRDRLEQEIQEARKNLQDQIEYSRLEHDTMQLRNRLQQLEDDRMKLQQMKEQNINDSQHRDEMRRQQDMLIRQREDDVLRRQQLGEQAGINQQETALRMQANALQDLLNSQEHSIVNDDPTEANQQQQQQPQNNQQQSQPANPEPESSTVPINQMNMMAPQMTSQARTFADAMAMGLQQPFIPMQQQMTIPPPNQNPQTSQPNIYAAFMPPQHQMQMPLDASGNLNFPHLQSAASYSMMPQQQQPQQVQATSAGPMRQQKFNNRQYNNNSGNNANMVHSGQNGGGRPRKRGKY